MTDRFASRHATLTSPAYDGFPITTSDAAPVLEVTRAIYVGVAGDLTATFASGETVTFQNVVAGGLLKPFPIRFEIDQYPSTLNENIQMKKLRKFLKKRKKNSSEPPEI